MNLIKLLFTSILLVSLLTSCTEEVAEELQEARTTSDSTGTTESITTLSATVANSLRLAPSVPTLLSQQTTTTSLLDSGRNLAVRGFGISNSARQVNAAFLNQSQSFGNQILSLAAGTDSSIEGAKLQINALRASLSDNQLAPSLRGTTVDEEA